MIDARVSELAGRFQEVVRSEEELRTRTGPAHDRAVAKVVGEIDAHARRFIAASPFVFIASAGRDGHLDVSPKGDPAGFVKVLDPTTLAIPDRLGNQRHDTFLNVLANPAVGLIFIVPGVTWTLRVSGQAIVVRDADLRESLAERGKPPHQVLVVGVERVLSHCPKCMVRSSLWKPDAWPGTGDVPSFAETLVAHARLADSVETVAESIEAGNRDRLY